MNATEQYNRWIDRVWECSRAFVSAQVGGDWCREKLAANACDHALANATGWASR